MWQVGARGADQHPTVSQMRPPIPAGNNLARCQQCPGGEPCLVPTSGRLGSDPRAGKDVVSTIVQRQ